MTWTDAYQALDNESLALIANPGMVRRAAKLLTEKEPTWIDNNDKSGTIKVDSVEVHLDGRGPTQARCPCPATGICTHILVATMFVTSEQSFLTHSTGPDDDVTKGRSFLTHSEPLTDPNDTRQGTRHQMVLRPADTGESPAIPQSHPVFCQDLVEEVLGLNPATICKAAGIAAVRRVHQRLAETPTAPLAECTSDQLRLTITWPNHEVRYLRGGGFESMVSTTPASQRAEVHFEALVRAFAVYGKAWEWPAQIQDEHQAKLAAEVGLTAEQSQLIAATQAELSNLVEVGLSHLSPHTTDRIAGLVTRAQTSGLPLLARYLGVVQGQVNALAIRADDFSETDAAGGLAQAWALTQALKAAEPAALPRLRGQSRRSFVAGVDCLELVPLGAHWWVTDSGARGITLVVWDATSQQHRTATTARPAGVDPNFIQSGDTTALWNASLRTILSGPFQLVSPKIAADSSLSASTGTVCHLHDQWPIKTLDELALTQWNFLAPQFGQSEPSFVLLKPTRRDKLEIDEPHQQLIWPVTDSQQRRINLAQPVKPSTQTRIDNLLAIENKKVLYILAKRTATFLEPITVIIQDKPLQLVALDFVRLNSPKSGLASLLALWRRRIDAQKMDPTPQTSTITRLCDDIRELITEVLATGRTHLSPSQTNRSTTLATRSHDLALATLATALTKTQTDLTPENLLRVQFLADRLTDLEI